MLDLSIKIVLSHGIIYVNVFLHFNILKCVLTPGTHLPPQPQCALTHSKVVLIDMSVKLFRNSLQKLIRNIQISFRISQKMFYIYYQQINYARSTLILCILKKDNSQNFQISTAAPI